MQAVIETERLRLEPFALSHLAGLRAMDDDPEIMRYINEGQVKSEDETLATIERVQQRWQRYGFPGGRCARRAAMTSSGRLVCSI